MFTGREYFPGLGLYDYRNRFYYPVLSRFLQADPLGLQTEGAKLTAEQKALFSPGSVAPDAFASSEINLYRYCGDDPVDRGDPMGLYARGDGFTDRQWEAFNRAQQDAANKIEKAAANMDRNIFEKVFGKGSATPENLAKVARLMERMVGALRDDGRNGFVAHATHDWRINAMRGNLPKETLAHTVPNSTVVFANVDHTRYFNASSLTWATGHEAGHDFGLKDVAYKHQKQLYNTLTSSQALQNADSFMDFATR